MTAKPEPVRLQLPPGLTPDQEARWWDDHPEYWDMVDTPLEWFGPEPVEHTAAVEFVLPVNLIADLKAEAARQQLPYQTLVRTWLQERLDAAADAVHRS